MASTMDAFDKLQEIFKPLNDYVATLDIKGLSGVLLLTVICVMAPVVIYANYVAPTVKDPFANPDLTLPRPSPIVSLRIYPIKSCRGIQVQRIKLKKTGLDLDRNWMFVDAATNTFLTIRSDATMTLINTKLTQDMEELTISIQDTDDSVTIPSRPTQEWLESNAKLADVEIWGEKTDGWEYSDEINNTFSKHFQKPVKLIYKGPQPRINRVNGGPEMYGKEVSHHFADVVSLQLASEGSLADLNLRLKDRHPNADPITIERFRPNIVIKGAEPWAEDYFKRVRITTINHDKEELRRYNIDVVARCARCQVPNVNPDTAFKDPKEPWDTLMKFRRVDKGGAAKWKPCFGMLCVPKDEGEIWVDSTLEILEITENHSYNTAKFEDL